MSDQSDAELADTGERMIPTAEGEVSLVFSRHEYAYRYALQFVGEKDVLDVGCGTGYGCKILAAQARHVVGIDHDAGAIAYCRTHFDAPNLVFKQADVTSLKINSEFDVAVSFQVIEHVHDTDDFVRRMKQAVRPKGLILITTPNVKSSAPGGDVNPFHLSEMNYEQFTSLISRHFSDYRMLGVGYPSRNWLRSMIQKLPLYRKIGHLLKRGSSIKSVAAKALDATRFAVLEDGIAEEAIDLLAVCTNEQDPL